LTRKLLALSGIGKERLHLAWVSSAEAQRFVEVVTGFTDSVKSVLEREYYKNLIYQAIKEGFTSVRDINGKINLELKRISFLLADMEKTGMVEFTGMENKTPVFATL